MRLYFAIQQCSSSPNSENSLLLPGRYEPTLKQPQRIHTAQLINQFDAVIRIQESPPHKQVFSRMQLALHATRPTLHGASDVCLAREARRCSVSAL